MKKLLSLFVLASLLLTVGFVAAGNSGSIKTTTSPCGSIVNENHYFAGETVYIHVFDFDANTEYPWNIRGQPGGASCDPKIIVASGEQTTDSEGNLCFAAYTINEDDCGEYKVTFGKKSPKKKTDNYRIGTPIVPGFGAIVGIATALGALGVFFLVRRN